MVKLNTLFTTIIIANLVTLAFLVASISILNMAGYLAWLSFIGDGMLGLMLAEVITRYGFN